MENDRTKTCTKCLLSKPLAAFGKAKRYAGGLRSWCKSCAADYVVARYHENPEAFREKARRYSKEKRSQCRRASQRWIDSNRDRVRAMDRERYKRDRVKRMAYVLSWAARNPEKRKEYCGKWDANNPDKKRAYVRNRQAKKIQAVPAWADLQAIAVFYAEARRREIESGNEFHVDHIVPLRSRLVCGLHWEGNLQVLASYANGSKGNRHWPNMPEEI